VPQAEAREQRHARSRFRRHDRDIDRNIQDARAKRHARREDQRGSRRRNVRTNAEFGAVPRPHSDHPTQARKRDTLLEPADQRDPFGDHRHAAVPGVELLFELPAELRDVRRDVDVAILKRLDDAVGQ